MNTMNPSGIRSIEIIKERVPEPDILEQLAEEAAELSQAANKLARIKRGVNPSNKSEEEAKNDLIEEYTDVYVVGGLIFGMEPDGLLRDYKLHRWEKRLIQKKNTNKCNEDMCELDIRI